MYAEVLLTAAYCRYISFRAVQADLHREKRHVYRELNENYYKLRHMKFVCAKMFNRWIWTMQKRALDQKTVKIFFYKKSWNRETHGR